MHLFIYMVRTINNIPDILSLSLSLSLSFFNKPLHWSLNLWLDIYNLLAKYIYSKKTSLVFNWSLCFNFINFFKNRLQNAKGLTSCIKKVFICNSSQLQSMCQVSIVINKFKFCPLFDNPKILKDIHWPLIMISNESIVINIKHTLNTLIIFMNYVISEVE